MSDIERTTKYVGVNLTVTFHGDHLDKYEVTSYLHSWIEGGLSDRDDLRRWKMTVVNVDEVSGDPEGFDTCVDRDGNEYPEHDYDDIECRRCGAEPDA